MLNGQVMMSEIYTRNKALLRQTTNSHKTPIPVEFHYPEMYEVFIFIDPSP